MGADFKGFGLVFFASGGFGADHTQKLIVGNLSSRFGALSDSEGEHCIGNAIKVGEVQQPSVSSGSRCISQAW